MLTKLLRHNTNRSKSKILSNTGSIILRTTGEIEAEEIINELKENIQKTGNSNISFTISEPIINIREGVANEKYFFRWDIENQLRR